MTSEKFATTVLYDFPCCNDMYFSHILTRGTGSICFLRLLFVNYLVDLSASLRGGRSGDLFTSSRVANRLRDDNSLRLASNAGLCWNILFFDYYGFLPCLFNIAQGMRQSWDALQGEVDALDTYWGSWRLRTQYLGRCSYAVILRRLQCSGFSESRTMSKPCSRTAPKAGMRAKALSVICGFFVCIMGAKGCE